MVYAGVMGLLWLLLIAAVILCLLGVWAVNHRLRHPPRKTYAAALAHGDPTDPAELGLGGESVTFTLPDGTSTPGWIIAGGSDAGPSVVVVHGFGDSRYGALHWAPLLVPHAREVVLFDLPGHGESEAAKSWAGLGEHESVRAVMDQLERRGQGDFVLFGYSMGAGVAIVTGAADQRVRGVIADGPYRRWDEPLRAVMRRRRYPVWPIVPLLGLWMHLTRRGLSAFDRVEHAKRLGVPLLVLHGGEDWICPAPSARAIAEAAPFGQYVEFEDGEHLDLLHLDRERYEAALEGFFASLDSSRG